MVVFKVVQNLLFNAWMLILFTNLIQQILFREGRTSSSWWTSTQPQECACSGSASSRPSPSHGSSEQTSSSNACTRWWEYGQTASGTSVGSSLPQLPWWLVSCILIVTYHLWSHICFNFLLNLSVTVYLKIGSLLVLFHKWLGTLVI